MHYERFDCRECGSNSSTAIGSTFEAIRPPTFCPYCGSKDIFLVKKEAQDGEQSRKSNRG